MNRLRTRFGLILLFSLSPILLYAGWLTLASGQYLIAIIAMLSFGFAFTAIWFATDALIFKPLKKIQETASDFATGDLNTRIVTLENAPSRIKQLAVSFNSMADNISQREAAMLDSLTEKEVLLREIHHRVKNNLQIIISLLNMQERKLTNKAGISLISEARSRINAIALVHRGLYEGNDLNVIKMDDFLSRMVEELKVGLGTEVTGIDVTTHIMPRTLKPDTAIPVALFVVEALTNSIQHGVEDGGNVAISLTETDGFITVSVADNGNGYVKNAVQGTGYKLIEGFARQLSGDISRSNLAGHNVSLTFKTTNN